MTQKLRENNLIYKSFKTLSKYSLQTPQICKEEAALFVNNHTPVGYSVQYIYNRIDGEWLRQEKNGTCENTHTYTFYRIKIETITNPTKQFSNCNETCITQSY